MFVCFLSLPCSLTGLPISRVVGCRKTLQQALDTFNLNAVLPVCLSLSLFTHIFSSHFYFHFHCALLFHFYFSILSPTFIVNFHYLLLIFILQYICLLQCTLDPFNLNAVKLPTFQLYLNFHSQCSLSLSSPMFYCHLSLSGCAYCFFLSCF